MGTFGTDLLGSDSAQDFVGGLAARPPAERTVEVIRVLTLAADDPSSIMRDIVPEEAIAAAVMVAAARPGGAQSLGIDTVLLADAPSSDLVRLAI